MISVTRETVLVSGGVTTDSECWEIVGLDSADIGEPADEVLDGGGE